MRTKILQPSLGLMVGALLAWLTGLAPVQSAANGLSAGRSGLEGSLAGLDYIDTSIENASPLWYEATADGLIRIHLLYDHERSSPNRAAGHLHFLIHGKTGLRLKMEFLNLDNVWNGRPGSVAKELKTVVVSENGRDWQTLATTLVSSNRVLLELEMPGPRLYVARMEPYSLSDLERLLDSIRSNSLVSISPIGRTVQGRPLEIVQIGRADAPYRVFLRARAHPWEAGGNWVVEGFIRRLLRGDVQASQFLQRYCAYILPMANKDGVAHGLTRFNLQGRDLNRDWDQPADRLQAPENAALEHWLEGMIRAGKGPHFALELHNDAGGLLHLSRPPVPGLGRHLERMTVFEKLMRQHTWFTEGATQPSFHNSGTLGDGWLERFGIDAAVLELNCNWIAGRNTFPSGKEWQAFGEGLAEVFFEYFGTVQPTDVPAKSSR